MMDGWAREEEEAIIDAYNNGEMSEREMRRELADLRRWFSDMVEQEAEVAADMVRENYYGNWR